MSKLWRGLYFLLLITAVLPTVGESSAVAASSDDATVESTYGFDFYVGQLADQTTSVLGVDNTLSAVSGQSPECSDRDLDDQVYGWCNSDRGAITNWAVKGGDHNGSVQLVVLKEIGDSYEPVGYSSTETAASNTTNRYTTNIPLLPNTVYRFGLVGGSSAPTEWMSGSSADVVGRMTPPPSSGFNAASMIDYSGKKPNLKVIVDRDTDSDEIGNLNDSDDDNDGVADTRDNCRKESNSSQTDTDDDQIGDACDEGIELRGTVSTSTSIVTTTVSKTTTVVDPWIPTEKTYIDPDPRTGPKPPWCKRYRKACDTTIRPDGPVKRLSDQDGDGTDDDVESKEGSNPLDVDSDDDGVGDQEERRKGTSPVSNDTDRDGLADGTEAGVTSGITAKRRYGSSISGTDTKLFRGDSDPRSTTLLTVSDSDHDGIDDGKEDRNHNGKVDAHETSPTSRDTDRDGISDREDRHTTKVTTGSIEKTLALSWVAKTAEVFGGTRASDTVRGTSAKDKLAGGFAPDHLYGNGGDDVLDGASGDDKLDGGSGSDTIDGGSGDDEVITGSGANTVDAGDGDDQITGGGGSDFLYGGRYGHEKIDGGGGDDFVDAYRADDELTGGSGDDLMYGGPGRDYISGDDGDDVINGGESRDVVDGGAGDDTIYGGFDADSSSLDSLSGGSGNDSIYTFSSVDISCGSGRDTVYVIYLDPQSQSEKAEKTKARKLGSRVASVSSSADLPVDDVFESSLQPADFEDIFGTAWDETMESSYSTSAEFTLSNGSSSSRSYTTSSSSIERSSSDCESVRSVTISSKQAIDPFYDRRPAVLSRTDSELVLAGSRGEITRDFSRTSGSDDADNLVGTAKNDRVLAKRGKDLAFGGDGNDEIEGEEDPDEIGGGNGDDQLFGRKGDDLIYGDAGNDELWGSRGADLLDGGLGDDVLYGGLQADKFFGGAGNDRIVAVSGGSDRVDCGPGSDVAFVDSSDRVSNCERVRRH